MIRIVRLAVLPLFLCVAAYSQPRADFTWSPENPGLNSLVLINDQSVGATSTTFYIENSHPQPGSGAATAFSAAGVYELKMVATSAAGTSTKVRWINAGLPSEARMLVSRTTAVIGQSIAFADQSSGLVQSRSWNFGDGATSSAESPSHSYAAAGTYTVTLRANYNSGSRTTTRTITVQGAPEELEAAFDWTPEIPFIGQTVTFREHAKGEPTSWSWSFGDDSDDQTSTSRTPTHKYARAGRHLVTLAVKKGTKTEVLTRELHVASSGGMPILEPEFSVAPACLIAGEPMQFIDRSDGFPIRWLWNFGNGRTSSERSPRGTYEQPGRYVVTLELFDGVQTRSTSQTITVNPNFALVPQANFASPCCAAVGIARELHNTSSDATSYRWDFGDGQTSTEKDPKHVWAQPGSYMIRLIAANEHGEHQIGRSIHVEQVDTTPIADFIWEPSAHIGIGQKVAFTNRSGSDAVAFLWTVSGPGMQPRQAVTREIEHTFAQTGTYAVKLDATDAYGKTGTVTRQVPVVDGKLIASFQCRRTGSRSVVQQFCGGCRCTSLDTTQTRCLAHQPSDCEAYNYVTGQPTPGCITPETVYLDDFTCSDQSSGAPDLYEWLVPHLREPERTGREIQFSVQIIPGMPYTLWVHHTVHRLVDGQSSTAIAEIPSSGGGAFALKSDFSWSPGFPRVGDEVTFEQKADGASTFEWLVNGELRLSGPSFKYTFKEGGKHEVTLRVGGAARTDSRVKIIEVGPKATPEFKQVTSRWGQCFFSTVPLQTEIEATMNWGGTPARASYSINDGPAREIDLFGNTGDTFSFPINSQELLFSEFSGAQRRNVITITAKNGEGDEARLNFRLDTYNTAGNRLTNVQKTVREAGRYTITNLNNVPQPEWEGEIQFPSIFPFIGGKKIGLKKTQASLESSFRTDCTASETIKGQTGFQVGPGIITGALFGKGELQMGPSGIFAVKETLGFELAGAIEPEPIPVLSAVPSAAALCAFPALGGICDALKVKSEFKLAAGAEFDFTRPRGEPVFDDGRGIITPLLKVGLIGQAAAGLSFEVWGGGQAAFTIHPIPPIVRKIEAAIESGLAVNVFLYQVESKMAIVCEWEPSTGWKPCLGPTPIGASVNPLHLKPRPVHQQPELLSRRLRMRGESVVLESLSPIAAPEGAASGDEIMAVYLSENPNAANALHRTDVRYTTRENGAWTESQALTADALGDFAPSLIGASDGRFIAMWQRVKNATLRLEDVATFDDLPKLNREMEVIASIWSPGSRTWSAPFALTDNDVFDHDARAVALADGRVIALWLRDGANGTEIVSRVLSGETWGSETIVASGLTGVQSLSAGSRGSEATLAFSREKDGNREIAVATFTNASWSVVRDLTSDAVADNAPNVVYGSDGARVLWMSGADLVWQPAAGGTREVVRASDGSAALLDATVTSTLNGELVVVWSESSEGTADIIARTYDPALRLWSEDITLTRNDAVESSLSTFFADGKLQVTGLETNTVYTDVTRVIDGATVVIPDVAQPGSVSLIHLDKELVVDLSIDQNTLAVSADAPTNGQEVKLTAMVCNEGDLPLRDVAVAVYTGRGTNGVVLASATVAGDWRGGESRPIEIAFPFSDAAQEITLAVDPRGLSGDRALANNEAYFSYRNAPPVACLQLNRMIGNAPMTVAFDSRCSTDPDGRVVDVQWSFGDGGAAFGDVASHTFTAQGIYTATVTVTDDLGRSSTASSSVYVSALSELRNHESSSSLYLPVAGRTAGAAGTFFVSDATVFNPNRAADLVVDALYLPDGRLDYHYARLVVPPERMLDLTDFVAKTFHSSGVGWVRFDLSDPHAVITSRSYNQQPIGTAGTLVPAAKNSDAIRAGSRRVFLQDWRTGYRANVGLTEISGDGANVTVSSFDATGALAGTKTYPLAPWSHIQVNGEPLFQRSGRIEITVDSGAVLGYLSTVDNRTGDAVYQEGLDLSSIAAGARWIVPTVGRLPGANNTRWRSDVRIWNGESTPQTIQLELRRGATNIERQIVLQAGETVSYDDIVGVLYPELGDAFGVLAIRGNGVLAATSRIYNESADGGTYGMAAPPRMERDFLTAGDQRDLLQIAYDEAYRCNFGVTALDEGAQVRVSAYDPNGHLLGAKTYQIQPRTNVQVPIFPDLGITTTHSAARLQVHVLSGRAYAYASVIDNKTGDAIFVEAER